MNFGYKYYELNPLKENLGWEPQSGCLLRVEFDDGKIGYSSLHPQLIFGDFPVAEQLQHLKSGQSTPLIRNSLHWARVDSEYRFQGKSAFEGLVIPKSHCLVLNLSESSVQKAIEAGFSHVKLKAGENILQETLLFESLLADGSLKIRIDFNGKLSCEDFQNWWEALSEGLKSKIDFIEDPYPFNAQSWSQAQAPLAVDQDLEKNDHEKIQRFHKIFKPAQNSLPLLDQFSDPVVFTSYMDHPLGEMAAIYCAAQFYKSHSQQICGFQTWTVFEFNEFSEQLTALSDSSAVDLGSGFGFDDQLEPIDWVLL